MAAGIPSTNQILPFSGEALQRKTKLGAPLELPGLFYNQATPSPAVQVSSGTVTNSGTSFIGAFNLGQLTTSTAPWGGDCAVTFSSSSGLLATTATSGPFPTTLNYDQFPVTFSAPAGVLPTGIVGGQTYYWQWVSATTGRLSATPGGTVIAYTDAGSGTIYMQARAAYWGSPFVPAGFLQASDGLAQATPASFPQSGSLYRIEIMGHKTGASISNTTISAGLVTGAGATSYVNLISSAALAQVVVGPFPFKIAVDIEIQQYGLAAASSPYVQAMIKSMMEVQIYTAASGINTTAAAWSWAAPIATKVTSIDTTQALGFDVRALDATPNVGNYYEPLIVRMWAYN